MAKPEGKSMRLMNARVRLGVAAGTAVALHPALVPLPFLTIARAARLDGHPRTDDRPSHRTHRRHRILASSVPSVCFGGYVVLCNRGER